MSSISIDVDIDDIIWGMGSYDRKAFFYSMQDKGYISKSCIITKEGEVKAASHVQRNALTESNDDFNRALQVLFGKGWLLTKEEEEYIITLSKRF
jgi:hypothetical protein